MTALDWLLAALKARMSPDAFPWLTETAGRIGTASGSRAVFTAFSAALRRAGKEPLRPDAALLAESEKSIPGWDPADWSCDQAARAVLLLSLPADRESARLMDQIYETADVGEAVALLKALPLLPCPEAHLLRAREGARSNVKLQFEAVALRNPYPAAHFDAVAWNQMVAKALFVGSPLEEILGLDARCNPDLSAMLADHASERKAAGRPYDPQLWRCVGPHAGPRALEALAEALAGGAPAEQRAAALALSAAGTQQADAILEKAPALAEAVRSGALRWDNFTKGP